VISGYRREVAEICTFLDYYTAGSGNLLPMFRDNGSHPRGSYIIILLACLLLNVASSTIYRSLSLNIYQFLLLSSFPPCFFVSFFALPLVLGSCILHGLGGERIVDVVPGGMELKLQLRWGVGLGRRHLQ